MVRLDNLSVVTVITWVSPEIIMLLTSIVLYIECKKIFIAPSTLQTNEEGEITQKPPKKKKYGFLVTIGEQWKIISARIQKNKKLNF